MCDETGITSPKDNESDMESHEPPETPVLIVGSYDEVMDGLSVRHVEEDNFDVTDLLARAGTVIPESATIVDAVNQYGYALVRFPEGKSFKDLMPRKTPGYEGWSHFATYDKNGGVGGGNAAIRQAGLQPAAIANLAIQSAAFALGLAYMTRIDNKMGDIYKSIRTIRDYLEEDYMASLQGDADSLLDYAQNYDIYADDYRQCVTISNEAEAILRDLNKCWRKELSRMSTLLHNMRQNVQNVTRQEAEEYLARYSSINRRSDLILELSFLARQVRLHYNGDMSSRRIDLDKAAIARMRDQYSELRDNALKELESIASVLRVPIGESLAKGTGEGFEIIKSAAGSRFPRSSLGLVVLGIMGIASTTMCVSDELRNGAGRQRRKLIKGIATTEDNVERLAESFEASLDRIDFEYNKANGLLIDGNGIRPVEVEARATMAEGIEADFLTNTSNEQQEP